MSERKDPAVLLDRDGVINENRADYVRTPADLTLLPRTGEALRLLTEAAYRVLVITNQQCVAKGLVTLADVEAIHDKLRQLVAAQGGRIDGIYVCPHHADDRCACRKPKPGLIEQAHVEWGFDPKVTWMVGDKMSDANAARVAGCKPALVRSGLPLPEEAGQIAVFEDLLDFVHRGLGLGTMFAWE